MGQFQSGKVALMNFTNPNLQEGGKNLLVNHQLLSPLLSRLSPIGREEARLLLIGKFAALKFYCGFPTPLVEMVNRKKRGIVILPHPFPSFSPFPAKSCIQMCAFCNMFFLAEKKMWGCFFEQILLPQ